MAWSESDLQDALRGGDASVQDQDTSKDTEGDDVDTSRSASMQAVAKGSTPKGEMNDTEDRWATLLDASEHVHAWKYEEKGFRYGANDSTHWPDFWVIRQDGKTEIHEVKGYVKDAGRLRFLACADRHPEHRWIMVVQSSPQQAWACKYDTGGEGGAPFIQ